MSKATEYRNALRAAERIKPRDMEIWGTGPGAGIILRAQVLDDASIRISGPERGCILNTGREIDCLVTWLKEVTQD